MLSKLTTPLAAAELLEIFRKKTLVCKSVQRLFIYQTMVECQTGRRRPFARLLRCLIKSNRRSQNRNGRPECERTADDCCNDIGFVLYPMDVLIACSCLREEFWRKQSGEQYDYRRYFPHRLRIRNTALRATQNIRSVRIRIENKVKSNRIKTFIWNCIILPFGPSGWKN